MRIISRGPGLAEIGKTASQLVDEADADLRRLLKDPYYYEAFQRMLRRGDDPITSRPGLLPTAKGDLANKLQMGQATKQLQQRGRRPRGPEPGVEFIIRTLEGLPGMSAPEFFRRVLRGMFPNASDRVVKKKAAEHAQAIRNEKKRRAVRK